MNTTLINATKICFANAFAYYVKTSNYHWNVEGIFFQPLHELFGQFYVEIHAGIDAFAEHLRSLGATTPGTLTLINSLSSVTDDQQNDDRPSALRMLTNLKDSNEVIISDLKEAISHADDAEEHALSDFLSNQMEIHQKHLWMINSSLVDTK